MIFDDWEQLSTPTIRPGTPSDVDDIARIHVRGWRREHRDLLPDSVRKGFRRPDSARIWMRLIAGGDSGPYVLVAEHPGDGIIGFIAAGPERSENPDFDGEVYSLYIDRQHQRSGVGRTLLQYVAQIMSENAQNGLLVWSSTESPSNEFFRRLGGQEIATRLRRIDGVEIEETAFGWPDLRVLLIEGYEPIESDGAEPSPDSDVEPASDPQPQQGEQAGLDEVSTEAETL
jgi:ribosomal protein S18 acetylase RimI-like enzyme